MMPKITTETLNKNIDVDVLSIVKLESQNNQVFFINKKYIAKTTFRNKEHFDFLKEKFKNSKIKIPKILIIKKITPRLNLIIYKFLKGKSFSDITKIEPKTWIMIGIYLKEIHALRRISTNNKNLPNFSKKNWSLFFNNFKKYKNNHKKLVPETISKDNLKKAYDYLSDLEKLKTNKLALLHGDYVLKNILLNKQKKISGIIDFENSQIGDPLIELGFIYLWDGLMTDWNNISRGYFSKNYLNKNTLINIKKYSIICGLILLSKNDLNKNQYRWIKNRFKKIIDEISL